MARGDLIILNSPFNFRQGRLRKNGTRGKGRYTIDIKSEPILHDLNERRLGQPVADALRETISKQIKGIGENARAATTTFRAKAERSLAAGARWAQRRYSGGRTGTTAPDSGQRTLFNDSGRFANGLFTRLNSDDSFTTNVPANRLDPTTFRGTQFDEMLVKLRRLVPVLDPKRAGREPAIRKAVEEQAREFVKVTRSVNALKREQLRKAKITAALAVYRAGKALLG